MFGPKSPRLFSRCDVRISNTFAAAEQRAKKTKLFHARNYPSRVFGCCYVNCKQPAISNDITGHRYDVDFAINANTFKCNRVASVCVCIPGRRPDWNKFTIYKYKTNTPIRCVSWSSVNDSKSSNVHKHELCWTLHGSMRSRHFLTTRMTDVYFIVFYVKILLTRHSMKLLEFIFISACINRKWKVQEAYITRAIAALNGTYVYASLTGSIAFSLSAQLNRVALNWCRKNIVL